MSAAMVSWAGFHYRTLSLCFPNCCNMCDLFLLWPLPGTSNRKAWKERTLTGDTASPLSTITTYSWLASSSFCFLLYCTYGDSAAFIGAQLSVAPPRLYRGWKRALARQQSSSISKICRAKSLGSASVSHRQFSLLFSLKPSPLSVTLWRLLHLNVFWEMVQIRNTLHESSGLPKESMCD